MLKETKNISDYLDIDFLQTLQDNCSRALGLAFVMVDYRGCPITHYSGFTPYCQLGRKHKDFFEMCKQCDAHGGLQAVITGEPYIYRCHAGLVDFAMPLMCDGTYVGSLLGGQVRLSQDESEGLEDILSSKTDWRKDKDLNDAYNKMQVISYERVKSAAILLKNLLEFAMQNGGRVKQGKQETGGEQAVEEMDTGQIVEETQSTGREFSLKKDEVVNMKRQGRMRYFFFVLNIISQLAFQEKAKKTEAVAYDFADIMRYTAEPGNGLSTLGEELSYVGALLRIQKAWIGDSLSYRIAVPEQYWGVSCPYMVMEPLVDMAVQGCEDGQACNIEILAEAQQGDVLLQVVSNREMALEEMEHKLDVPSQDEEFSLHDSDRNLKRIFGQRYGISIGLRKDGEKGHMASFCLPRKKEG